MIISNIYKEYRKIKPSDFEIIIAHVIQKPREFVLAHPEYTLNKNQELKIKNQIKRRIQGEPLAYITGHKEFYGYDFIVTKDTLIPRPETELLVEQVLQATKNRNQKTDSHPKTVIVDVGTGSGCIITSLAKEIFRYTSQSTDYKFIGIDISKNALEIAKRNTKNLGIEKNITFLCGNLLDTFLAHHSLLTAHYSLILVANLPYVPSDYLKQKSTQETIGLTYEPKNALDGGEDGLDYYKKLIQQTRTLKQSFPDISIQSFYEIDPSQKDVITKLLHSHSQDIPVHFTKDLAGLWRICSFHM